MLLQLPFLDFTDASLVLAIGAIILLVTAQIMPASFCVGAEYTIDKKKLHNAAMVSGAMFIATIVIRIVSII
jgi:hypothetical protein